MRPVLALDQGTTSSRSIVFSPAGEILAVSQRELPQHYPQPGWVEHDPERIVSDQLATAVEALKDAGLEPSDLAGIGITNQRETLVCWDSRTGLALGPAIVWQDRRTAEICRELKQAGHEDLLRARTGLLLDPYFTATKLAWRLRNDPDIAAAALSGRLRVGTVDSWLIHRLTGAHLSDASNASRTALYDIHLGRWDDELLELFGVPGSCLPEVVDSAGRLAEVKADSPLAGTWVCGVAGDQQAALFGQRCRHPGEAKCTYGTGAFLLEFLGDEAPSPPPGVLNTVAWQLDGRRSFALEGSVFIAGALIQWLRDGLGLIDSAAQVEALANSVSSSAGVVIVPAFTGLGAPWWDSSARGTILGLTRGSGRPELARAALEAIAHQVCDLVEAMGVELEFLRVDGGAASNGLLMRMQASLLGTRVERPRMTETTALGAAMLAWLGAGETDQDGLDQIWQADASFTPDTIPGLLDRSVWKKAVNRAGGWID